ncbi:MAG: GNAT family N-acetyltransferase [Gemmatimonadaceae bacterium]|nr:GNAT family N-acetyltransferase [Gemmatimonadaceae bacterium]
MSPSAPPPPVTIRAAHPGDAAALTELGRRTFTETFGADNTAEDLSAFLDAAYTEAIQERELREPTLQYLVAERDASLVGFSLLRRGKPCSFVADPAALEIQRFYVDATCHGTGLAQRLMDATVAEARRAGARTLFLGVWERNARAIRFYAAQGFAQVGTQVFTVGSDDQTDAVMVRHLDP